jgi:hypothetical protein
MITSEYLINSVTCNEIAQPVIALRNSMVNELNTTAINDGRSEWWSCLLRDSADQQELGTRNSRKLVRSPLPYKFSTPFPKLDASLYRSCGGYFDYSNWIDRDRFMELDKAISLDPRRHSLDLEPDLVAA